MAKAASPVRLEKELMEAASRHGERLHRSAAEQVEYWADIGRTVDASVSPDSLLEVATGLARLKVVPVIATPVNPVEVFARLKRDSSSGALTESIASGGIRYQASRQFPGKLERVDAEGQVTVGVFENGEFTVVSASAGSASAAQA